MPSPINKPLNTNAQRASTPWLLLAPLFAYYALFWLGPVGRAAVSSFQDASGTCSLQGYRAIFSDTNFMPALVNTGVIVFVSVALEFALAMGLALLINLRFKGSGIFFALALIPMALPEVAIGAIWNSGLSS
ncbi:MAG: sugar ABC transporter permease, partial [Planctomycetes bacterium]|nr:sugar ABC transporter permease [Planctomycetota bacterium]